MSPLLIEALRGVRLRAPLRHRLLPAPGGHLRFMPRSGWQREHLLTAETGTLLASLKKPRTISPRDIAAKELARLVLDGLVEVECRGAFLSGGRAHPHLFTVETRRPRTDSISLLSVDALKMAISGTATSPPHVADHLYRYNTLPRSPRFVTQFRNDHAAARFLAPRFGDRIHRRSTSVLEHRSGPWRSWSSTRSKGVAKGDVTWKLYVSPAPERTGEAAAALLDSLGRRQGPFSMKVGCERGSVLRPDRLVAYFTQKDDMIATAKRLRLKLDGMPAHGVPFTAAIGRDGLLSWGADFPSSQTLPSHPMERSWRGWVAVRLASAIVTALASRADDPVQFSLDRVALDGVNTKSWAPSARLLRAR